MQHMQHVFFFLNFLMKESLSPHSVLTSPHGFVCALFYELVQMVPVNVTSEVCQKLRHSSSVERPISEASNRLVGDS